MGQGGSRCCRTREEEEGTGTGFLDPLGAGVKVFMVFIILKVRVKKEELVSCSSLELAAERDLTLALKGNSTRHRH